MKSSMEATGTQLPSKALRTQYLTACRCGGTIGSSCRALGKLRAAAVAGVSFWLGGRGCFDLTQLDICWFHQAATLLEKVFAVLKLCSQVVKKTRIRIRHWYCVRGHSCCVCKSSPLQEPWVWLENGATRLFKLVFFLNDSWLVLPVLLVSFTTVSVSGFYPLPPPSSVCAPVPWLCFHTCAASSPN